MPVIWWVHVYKGGGGNPDTPRVQFSWGDGTPFRRRPGLGLPVERRPEFEFELTDQRTMPINNIWDRPICRC